MVSDYVPPGSVGSLPRADATALGPLPTPAGPVGGNVVVASSSPPSPPVWTPARGEYDRTQSLFTRDVPGVPAQGAQAAAPVRGAMSSPVMEAPAVNGRLRNRVLGALPAEDIARVCRDLEFVQLQQRESLFEPEAPIRYVYFPETAVVSLVSVLGSGATVEVGTAGCEGMAGLPVLLAEDTSSVRAFAQIPGVAGRMDAETFTRLAAPPGPLHRILLRYAQAFLTQVAQTAACNTAHLVEERCARWLLMTHDRADGDELQLTHEFLAFMLGVRRTGVTVAMRALQQAGLVHYARGRVTVVDRRGLEGASCECYSVVRAHFERLLPPSS